MYRSIVKQASGLIIFPCLRARQSLKALSIQLFDRASFLPAVSGDVVKSNNPYTPLFLDLRNTTPDSIRVRSGFLGVDKNVAVYQTL